MAYDYPKRANILALASKISLESLTYTGVTYNDPEYKILVNIVDDDMCDVCMHLRLDKPRKIEDIARRCKKDVAWTQEQIDKLVIAGIVRGYTRDDGKLGYAYPIWVPGIMEGILSNRENCDTYPIIGEAFEEYTRRRLEVLVPFLDRGMAFMRVMPVQSAIENNTHKASYDELSTLIDKATAISVGPCSCRRSRRLMGEGCGHLEDDMCIYLNDNARNYVKAGAHRMITKEEAYEILARAEANGLVHNVNQTPGFEETAAICNCCGCSCYALRIAEYFRRPEDIASNFRAVVDKNKCVACGQCVENCQVNALKLGEKLCSTKPIPVTDPHIDIKTSILDKKAYNVDYRTNRSDVYATGTSPCKAACPAHIAVQGYIKLAGEGRYTEALELIKKDNPFPAICGRVCNKACEDACTRAQLDEAVAIDDIKKFIAEKELDPTTRFVPKMLNQTGKPYTEKIAVIGAGPAGLSCAYYLAVKGYPVTVFEKEAVPGGMMVLGIPSYRLERAVINAEIDVLKELGVEFRCGVEIGKDITMDALHADGYKAFYLAIGAQGGVSIGCPGDKLPGVMTGIDFLREVNLGKAPEIGKRVAVIGGGNVAMDVARSAVRLGADEVTVIYRRSREDMPADKEELAEAEAEGIKFMFMVNPAEITGEGKAEVLRLEKMAAGKPGADGRPVPIGSGEFTELAVDSVISSVGQKVLLNGIADFETSKRGTVIADGLTYQTSVKDVFAGGDVVTGPKFVINAIAAGKEGAISIHRYVHEGQTLDLGRDRRDYRPIDKENIAIVPGSFDQSPRQKAAHKGAGAAKTFDDLRGTLNEEQIKKEAARCLGCGAVVVDDYMCIGCGVCTTKCRFDAIRLERVADFKGTPYFKTLLGVVGYVPTAVAKTVTNRSKLPRK